jgi:predicted permease
MKIQHKVIHSILGLSLMVGVVSCKKGFEELNKPYKDATVSTATPAGFFNNLAKRATEACLILIILLLFGAIIIRIWPITSNY